MNEAIRKGNYSYLKYLIDKQNYDVNVKDEGGNTPLHLACIEGKSDIVELLLENYADITILDNRNWSPLHMTCVRLGHSDIADMLLSYGAVIDAVDDMGETPLHWACRCGNVEIVRLFLNSGANIHALNSRGQSIIHIACLSLHLEILQIILQYYRSSLTGHTAGIAIQPGLYHSSTPSSITHSTVVRCGGPTSYNLVRSTPNIMMLKLLNTQDIDRQFTALHILCSHRNSSTIDQVKLMTNELLNYGLDSSLKDTAGNTCLHYACKLYIDENLIKMLITSIIMNNSFYIRDSINENGHTCFEELPPNVIRVYMRYEMWIRRGNILLFIAMITKATGFYDIFCTVKTSPASTIPIHYRSCVTDIICNIDLVRYITYYL